MTEAAYEIDVSGTQGHVYRYGAEYLFVEPHPEYISIAWTTQMTAEQVLDVLLEGQGSPNAPGIAYLAEKREHLEMPAGDVRSLAHETAVPFFRIDGTSTSYVYQPVHSASGAALSQFGFESDKYDEKILRTLLMRTGSRRISRDPDHWLRLIAKQLR